MTATAEIRLGCPRCRSANLATLEQIPGRCHVALTLAPGGKVTVDALADGTDVDWDNQTTVGVECRDCDWTFTGDDWAYRLIPTTATMTVRVPDRRHDPVGHATIRTLTISTTCPCGGPRGVPRPWRFSDDGEWKTCDRWTNPCGHIDGYEQVLALHDAAAVTA